MPNSGRLRGGTGRAVEGAGKTVDGCEVAVASAGSNNREPAVASAGKTVDGCEVAASSCRQRSLGNAPEPRRPKPISEIYICI